MCQVCNDSGKVVIPSGSLTYFGPCLKCDIHIQIKERADRELRDMLKDVQERIRKRGSGHGIKTNYVSYTAPSSWCG
jgi:hypothetical protein